MMSYRLVLIIIIFCTSISSRSQELLIMDKSDGDKVVNDMTITAYSTDTSIIDLTKPFALLNNTDTTLHVYLRKIVHTIADSTIDYYCFGPQCWPANDTTDLPAILVPGITNYSFASHVVHVRRFETPPLPPGFTSITYIIFDDSTFSEPVEAKVTVNYHLSPVNTPEYNNEPFSVFPNPTSGWITLQTDKLNNGEFQLVICNTKGDIVIDRQTNINNGKTKFFVGELIPGIYFGNIINDNSKSTSFKFIVQ